MVLMKKGTDTRYVADVFIPHYLGKGYEVIFPKKKAETPSQVVVENKSEETPGFNGDDKTTSTEPPVTEEVEITEPTEDEAESAETLTDNEEIKSDDTVQIVDTSDGNKSLSCPICGKQYAKKAYLLKHIEKEHPED